MSLDADFLSMCSTSITVEPLSTFNANGAPVFSTGTTTYTAAVEYATRKVVTEKGDEAIATATIFVMSSSASISLYDRIAMRGSTGPRILRVDPVHDEEGQHHLEVYVN